MSENLHLVFSQPPWAKRRIEEASKFADIDQLCLSPQRGFSSAMEGNSLSRDEQTAKPRLVAGTAEEVWGTR